MVIPGLGGEPLSIHTHTRAHPHPYPHPRPHTPTHTHTAGTSFALGKHSGIISGAVLPHRWVNIFPGESQRDNFRRDAPQRGTIFSLGKCRGIISDALLRL